ncbi:nucleotidyltransferase domain-containing protein [Pontibacter sp. 172403-2]|uniref:nucleotidyltransferase domain-containing protein n=1 Tax=Pontibacter rufus TaxID=2791028 RepID=UPI0018AF5F38|nr:nucleotidyltransferase domain-containing protein [Pontibacter sp. 172403-2]MBF9253621.1 nucleotidyltransferase domain-containing protein [Pontibacter sp. 172403-2]
MLFGLEQEQVKGIQQVLASFPEVEEAIIFGSRAKGNFKTGSDIDLALKGTPLELDELLSLYNKLELLELPYTFDLVNYASIKVPDLTMHINRVGKVFYSKISDKQSTV